MSYSQFALSQQQNELYTGLILYFYFQTLHHRKTRMLQQWHIFLVMSMTQRQGHIQPLQISHKPPSHWQSSVQFMFYKKD